MSRMRLTKFAIIAALAALAASASLTATAAVANEVEVLTRGPVHEAFVETVAFNPRPSVVVMRECPPLVAETPPDLKPEGANVSWIPGYWAWDDERSNFLWISGIWRDLPYGRQWVPGYWTACNTGYQWIPGYWAAANVTEVAYLPEPPQTVEAGPIGVAPSSEYAWIPGLWVWQHSHYVWRPGFWAGTQAGWTWIPDHYVWSPRGYVYVNGYWDYDLARRGTLFAPVCFNTDVYVRTAYVYSPTIVIGLNAFAENLFIRPDYCHYYFGDYYAVAYERAGFYSCFAYHGHYGYDPIFVHERWEHRHERDWDRRFVQEFHDRREHIELRPPRTFALQQSLAARGRFGNEKFVMVAPLHQMAASHSAGFHFVPVTKVEANHFASLATRIQESRHERQEHELKPTIGHGSKFVPEHTEHLRGSLAERTHVANRERELAAVHKERLTQSPIVSRTLAHADKLHVPPKAHTTPKPDLKIQATGGQKSMPHPPTRFAPQHGETHHP